MVRSLLTRKVQNWRSIRKTMEIDNSCLHRFPDFSLESCSLVLYSQLARSPWEIHSLCRRWEDKFCPQLRHQQQHTEISTCWEEWSHHTVCSHLDLLHLACWLREYQVSCTVAETSGDSEQWTQLRLLGGEDTQNMILTQPMLVHSESHFILNLKCKLQKIETRTNYRSYSTTLD